MMAARLIRWVCVCTIFILYGCAPIQPDTEKIDSLPEEKITDTTVSSPRQIQYFIHTIKWPGENIVVISKWYTGSENNWLKIIESNPAVDPKQIKIGASILIPEALLKTHEPMPRSYLGVNVQSDRKKLQQIPTPPIVSSPELLPLGIDEIELFGPVYEEGEKVLPAESGLEFPLETIE